MADKSENIPESEDTVALPLEKQEVVSSCRDEDAESSNWEVVEDDVGDQTEEPLEGGSENCTGAVGGADSQEDGQSGDTAVNISGLDRLLQRHKNEIMFELRRLKFGDRPVTGRDDRRQAVAALVNRCVAQPSPRIARSRFDSLTSGRAESIREEPQRPEEIMIEVNALVERRPVSSILHSLAFRRSLENSLRGALGTIQRDISSRSNSSVPSPRLRPESAAGAAADTVEEATDAASNGFPEYQQNSRVSNIAASYENLTRGNISQPDGEWDDFTAEARTGPTIPVATPRRPGAGPVRPGPDQSNATQERSLPVLGDQPPVAGSQRASEWVREHVPPFANYSVETERQRFEFVHEMQRENLIVDISELIQRHLVTSALEGDFRQVLERRMRRRLDDSGIDGSRVQEQLRHLPRRQRRNDFMDQGAGAGWGAASDPLDDVSVISATAAVALPQAYTQSTAAMGRDIQTLRGEIRELKRMMQLSFDLQLDIQGAIRQEVAAAVSAKLGQPAGVEGGVDSSNGPTVAESLRRRSRRDQGSDSQCLICLDKPVDTVLYQCGHMCLCYGCGMQLRQHGAHCPVCRAPIRDIIKAFRN